MITKNCIVMALDLRKERKSTCVFLNNGEQIEGVITGVDDGCFILENNLSHIITYESVLRITLDEF